VTNKAALVAHRDLMITVRDRIQKAIREGKTLEQVREMRPTADFEERTGGPPAFIPQFVDGMYKELAAAR
jgi:hypothetical protein